MNKGKNEIKENTPSNLLKNGIDSIIYLFENKNNEYTKTLAENEIIISNMEKKIKKLTKENYILKKNSIRQNKLINELRNENIDLKNIINNIKGKLNIDSNIILKNTKKIKIDKLNINNFGNSNRTRNISNIRREISSSPNKEMCLTDRDKFLNKNNVLGIKYIKNKINFDKNFPYNEYIYSKKDNYYTRQRTKNNSFNRYLFKNETSINSKKNLLSTNTLETDTYITNNSNVLKHLSLDYKFIQTFHTIDINNKRENLNKINSNYDKIDRKNKKNIIINNYLKKCKSRMNMKEYKDIFNLFQDYRNEIFSNEKIIQKINFILKNYKELLDEFNSIKKYY